MPLAVERRWRHARALAFTLANRGAAAVTIGGLGLPMALDNIFTGLALDRIMETASFAEPYIGQDGGYVQVTRLNGAGPVLILAPGESRQFGVRFLLAPSVRAVEDRLAAAGQPVVVGLPGYIVAPDIDAALFVRVGAPVALVEVSPPGTLFIGKPSRAGRWERRSVAAT